MKITNITKGPRGLHAPHGIVVLEPGVSAEHDLTHGEYTSSKRTGWFAFEGEPPKPDVEASLDDDKAVPKHVGAGKYKLFIKDTVFSDEMYPDKAAAQEAADKLNAGAP
jgi:hypothetical protein